MSLVCSNILPSPQPHVYPDFSASSNAIVHCTAECTASHSSLFSRHTSFYPFYYSWFGCRSASAALPSIIQFILTMFHSLHFTLHPSFAQIEPTLVIVVIFLLFFSSFFIPPGYSPPSTCSAFLCLPLVYFTLFSILLFFFPYALLFIFSFLFFSFPLFSFIFLFFPFFLSLSLHSLLYFFRFYFFRFFPFVCFNLALHESPKWW